MSHDDSSSSVGGTDSPVGMASPRSSPPISSRNASGATSGPDITEVNRILARERDELKIENIKLRGALDRINVIRNSIVGLQNINWSEHIYPLVAALNDAGIEGMGYPAAREHFGTCIELLHEAVERLPYSSYDEVSFRDRITSLVGKKPS